MSENVKDQMAKCAQQIDQAISTADKNEPFQNHFEEWWNELNTRCSQLYSQAGIEEPSSLRDPLKAVNWLNTQTGKLHKFLADYSK